MGSFSVWHWIVLLVAIGVPVLLAVVLSRRVPKPFEPNSQVAAADLNWKQVYFGINGRITRQTWWLSHLVLLIPLILFALILILLTDPQHDVPGHAPEWFSAPIGLLIIAWWVAYVWSGICLNAKRWHDTDKSGWWQLIGLVPLLGLWALIENGFFKGTTGPNRFGPDPLA